jgi:hypothetical protein
MHVWIRSHARMHVWIRSHTHMHAHRHTHQHTYTLTAFQPLIDLLRETAIVTKSLSFSILDARPDVPPLALDSIPLVACSSVSVDAEPRGATLFA